MKISWGHALIIFFVLYISMLVGFVVKSTTVDHSLVVENYYDHDISYQAKLDKIANRHLLDSDLRIQYMVADNNLALDFGSLSTVKKVEVQMYRASNKDLDFSKPLAITDQKVYDVSLPEMLPGLWKVRVNWDDKDRSYFKEQDLYIN